MMLQKETLAKICLLTCAAGLIFAPNAFALPALEEWNAESRNALPTHVKIWLGTMMLTNIAAIGFLKNHVAARIVFGGFVISHGLVMVMWAQGASVLAGQVSLFHIIFWTPGLIALILKRDEIKLPSPYGIWACLSMMYYFGSMLVDVKDAVIYIGHLM